MKKITHKLKIHFIPQEENNHKPLFLKSNFLLFLIVGLVLVKLLFTSFTIILPYTNFFAEVSKSSLLSLINQKRAEAGLNSLSEDPKLNQAAYMKAKDMLEKDYFAHTSPDGKGLAYWLAQVNYSYKYAGENLGADFLSSVELLNAWLASPSHRANVMSPNYQKTGIAILSGDFKGQEMIVIVEMFGGFGPVNTASASTLPKTKPSPTPSKTISSSPKTTPIQNKKQINTSKNQNNAPPAIVKPSIPTPKPTSKNIQTQKQTSAPTPTPTLSEKEKRILEEAIKKNNKPLVRSGVVKGTQIENPSLKSKILSEIVINGDKISKYAFSSALTIVLFSLFLAVFVKIKIQHKDLILRGIFYSLILLAMLFLNTGFVVKIIPHTLGIM